MLAQNFMAAADLKITDEEHAALVKVLGMLERGDLTYVPEGVSAPNGFNMADWDCGTTHCILGWARAVTENHLSFLKMPRALNAVCYPHIYGDARGRQRNTDIDCGQAASALRNYLTLGEPRWAEVLAAQ